MKKHLSANRNETVVRIQAALKELAPAMNALKSEHVQLKLVDGFVLPVLLAGEVRMHIEASLEFLIGLASKLATGDQQKALDSLQLSLDALQAQKAVLAGLVARIDCTASRRADAIQAHISRMEKELERQKAEVEADETSPRQKAALDNLQKLLDILRAMNPQI